MKVPGNTPGHLAEAKASDSFTPRRADAFNMHGALFLYMHARYTRGALRNYLSRSKENCTLFCPQGSLVLRVGGDRLDKTRHSYGAGNNDWLCKEPNAEGDAFDAPGPNDSDLGNLKKVRSQLC